ncbi:MAG TPA: hypothetical protein H9807_05505 [Candidatus Bacteroides merdavium]|uniref:Uncharacterized protein n=1 Tax=Candidatus Bacteroides merdavium TaxID=2838472 RepID=A0A9D2GZE6_9BACE|nr:hypothetical protein [Candidatus Bacteroides merdavium]
MIRPSSTLHFRLLAIVLCLWTAGRMDAQEFIVRSFRMLPNDITAYIEPVRDLNDEACALLKVVGDKDFVFSSPLGIVKRKNDVGEIWIYLPKGSVMITIKHPQWGVLRDYRFPHPLESRMTYELTLNPPLGYQRPVELPALEKHPLLPDTTRHLIGHLPMPPTERPRRPREPWRRLLLINMGLQGDGPSAGLRIALMRRHGAYLMAQKDFHAMPRTEGECDRNGISTGATEAPYYTGRTENGRWMLMAGGIHRIVGDFCLYEGLGYGQRNLAWEQDNGTLLRNRDYSRRGLSAEAGCLYRFYRIAVSAGVMTIQGRYWEAAVGLGINF